MPIPGIIASSYPRVSGAFESIATVTASGSTSTITFSSIPSTYQHLQIRYLANSGRAVNGQESILVRLNGDSGTNYARHFLLGDGTSATASGNASQTAAIVVAACGLDAPTMSVGIIDIHDYSSTTKNKTIRSLVGVDFNSGTTESRVSLNSALWMNTAAVSSISFTTNTGSNWTTATTFALYGIKGA